MNGASSRTTPPKTAVVVPHPTRDGTTKLAARIASRLASEVIAQGWPVGQVLGSATDFTERYDVSRAVFREAVRLLEHQQVVRTQRGAAGGLIVTAPSLDSVTDAAVLYLHRVDAKVDEVFEARFVIEDIVIELACAHLDRAGRARLEAHLAGEQSGEIVDPNELHLLLAALTGNPALELLVHILTRLSYLYIRDNMAVDAKTTSQIERAHGRIVQAVLARDAPAAAEHMHRHLEAEYEFLRRRRATRPVLSSHAALANDGGHKRAEALSREIYQSIAGARLPPGHYLGSEPALLDRYGMSRAVFREAVRLLEYHHVAAMRRGTGGGLYVTAPSADTVTEVVALYLAWQGTSLEAVAELRRRVEVALVDLVIDRLDDAGAAMLDASAELDEGDELADVAIHNLHTTMAELTENRALQLVALVLIRLTRFRQDRPLTEDARQTIGADVRRAHAAIAAAVRTGDRERARRRMRRHLDAVTAFLS